MSRNHTKGASRPCVVAGMVLRRLRLPAGSRGMPGTNIHSSERSLIPTALLLCFSSVRRSRAPGGGEPQGWTADVARHGLHPFALSPGTCFLYGRRSRYIMQGLTGLGLEADTRMSPRIYSGSPPFLIGPAAEHVRHAVAPLSFASKGMGRVNRHLWSVHV